MKSFCKIFCLLLAVSRITAKDDSEANGGPVSAVMENLAYHTAKITDEIQLELNSKIDYNNEAILGNIEVITTNAMDKLSDNIFQAQQKLPSCPQSWNMEELIQKIDLQLTNCTSNLQMLRTVFQGEIGTIVQGIQAYVVELARLPMSCEIQTDSTSINGISTSFASNTACYVQKLTEMNRNLSQWINQANVSLLQTRMSTSSGVDEATICAAQVVENFNEYITAAFQDCL